MRKISFTEFRKDASALFSTVEEGESLVVLRHGKPIAEILPFREAVNQTPSWKKKTHLVTIKGRALSELLMDERETS